MTLIEMVRDVVFPTVKAAFSGWYPSDKGPSDPNALVKGIINTLLIVVVVAAVVYIMFAGIQYVSASGDATKAKTAMASITNALIGLIVAFAAYVLVSLVMSQVFNTDIQNIPT
jgi:amino acid transporter